MSQKEFQRVKVIENAAGGRLSVREASRLLQLSERQVQRLKRRYRADSVGNLARGVFGCALVRDIGRGQASHRVMEAGIMRVVLTGLWENERRVSSLVRSL